LARSDSISAGHGRWGPNQSFQLFEGETSSLDPYAQTSDFESERTNVKPKHKIPRPRNPLIDAVAAHDKSKLRRATERVMPQIEPKVDERDSWLEQIRTKVQTCNLFLYTDFTLFIFK
jgi:hypothetical protein